MKIEFDPRLIVAMWDYISDENKKEFVDKIQIEFENFEKDFPHYKNFLKNTQAGEDIEILIENEIFKDLTRVTNQNHDHL